MMNGRHLPAGQGVHDGRRRQQFNPQAQFHQQPPAAMYNGGGYYNQPYYPPQPPPPHYYNGGMPPNQYNPYAMYGRQPSMPYNPYAMAPPVVTTPPYGQPPMHSPAIVSTPYQPPPPASVPSSTHSSYITPVPMTAGAAIPTPPAPIARISPPPMVGAPEFIPAAHRHLQAAVHPVVPPPQPSPLQQPVSQFTSQHAAEITQTTEGVAAAVEEKAEENNEVEQIIKLPWFTRPDEAWPKRTRRINKNVAARCSIEQATPAEEQEQSQTTVSAETDNTFTPRPETPFTTQPPSEHAPSEHATVSEVASTTPTTPLSAQAPSDASRTITPTSAKVVPHKSSVSLVPALPKVLPKTSVPATTSKKDAPKDAKVAPAPEPTAPELTIEERMAQATAAVERMKTRAANGETPSQPASVEEAKPAPAPAKPSSWAALLKTATPVVPKSTAPTANAAPAKPKTNIDNLSDALIAFNAKTKDTKIAFLEPRGLVNTGNMCYMNSVLQVLVFCIPFYDFLEQVGQKAKHSFKSDTPFIDAMIMFMREFPTLASSMTVADLRAQLKDTDLEKYGDAFTPDFVYDVIRTLPRFASMRRGHQQDAEEFLGFLLEGLHDECVAVMNASAEAAATPEAEKAEGGEANGWLEVGPKQKAAVTRASGTRLDSPITKIFGGTLRSVLRVPGLKDSVTMEPYQPLQLDIHLPEVVNIVDALKGLTKPENITGDFKSPRGPTVTATKQMSIETLPSVLILHLKRFQYDNNGGTQKIWKRVGYPLDLEIPKEVFAKQKLGAVLAHGGLPKYRLQSVVYHHGKNASGGHYTVDVRRQDGREWIRLDDTVIRRVKAEDVADGGSEEDPEVLRKAMDAHKKDTVSSANIFSSMNDEAGGDGEWEQVTDSKSNGTKKSPIGTDSPRKKQADRFDIHDNKVAYLLFYQRIE